MNPEHNTDNSESAENDQLKFLAMIASSVADRERQLGKLPELHNIPDADQMNSAIWNAGLARGRAEQSIIADVPGQIFELAKPLAKILARLIRDGAGWQANGATRA